MNKELEEAAESISKANVVYESGQDDYYQGFIEGAKWQSERSYNEEDIINFVEWIANSKLHGYCKQLYEAMIINKVETTEDLLKVWFEKFNTKTKTII